MASRAKQWRRWEIAKQWTECASELAAELGKGIDVIDASAAKTDFIGHAYDGPQLFEDIRQFLHGLTVEQRLGRTLTKNPASGAYALVK